MKYLQNFLVSLMKMIKNKVNSIATIQLQCHKHDSLLGGGRGIKLANYKQNIWLTT